MGANPLVHLSPITAARWVLEWGQESRGEEQEDDVNVYAELILNTQTFYNDY